MCTTETGSFNVLFEPHAKGQGWDCSEAVQNRIFDKLEGAETASNQVMDRISQVVADTNPRSGCTQRINASAPNGW
jgi:hypothetical protein